MTATCYALQVKLDLILKDQPQIVLPDGSTEWDYEPESALIWIDPQGCDHRLLVPPAPMPLDYMPRTLCGRAVTTTRLRLVESDDHPDSTCRDCFVENMKRTASGLRATVLPVALLDGAPDRHTPDDTPRHRAVFADRVHTSMLTITLAAVVSGLVFYEHSVLAKAPSVLHKTAAPQQAPRVATQPVPQAVPLPAPFDWGEF